MNKFEAPSLGLTVLPEDPPVRCHLCHDTGWEEQAGLVKKCRACGLGGMLTVPASVPRDFKDARLSSYEPLPGNATAIRTAREFTQHSRDLYLYGGVGCGKTLLACALLNEHFIATRAGHFFRVMALLRAFMPDDDQDRLDAAEHLVGTAPLMVLDDLGAERDLTTDFTRRTLLSIYETRGDRGHRTIWTSNKSLDQLAQFLDDDRLPSRIAGRCDVVQIKTEDQRMARRMR